MTRLCAVATGATPEDLARSARLALDSGADMVELRLDHLEGPVEHLEGAVSSLPEEEWPEGVDRIATIRATMDGGAFGGDEDERVELLGRAAASGVDWLDLEGWLPRRVVEGLTRRAREGGTRTLVSWHLRAEDDLEQARVVASTAHADGLADAVKLVAPAEDRRGLDATMELSRRLSGDGVPHVVLPSGRLSRLGRLLAPLSGEEWVYVEAEADGVVGPLGLPNLMDVRQAWQRMGLRPLEGGGGGTATPPPMEGEGGDWTLLALLGDPVGHTMSPTIHHAALRAAGVRGAYVPYRTPAGGVGEALEALRAAEAVGCNVTVPLKLEAMEVVDRLGDHARLSGAVNTVVVEADGSLWGENTDVDGVLRATAELLGEDGTGMTALVVGTGGSARGACAGLYVWGARVLATGRDPGRLAAMVKALRGVAAPLDPEDLEHVAGQVDVLVHCTSQGMGNVPYAGPLDPIRVLGAVRPRSVLDMVYGRGPTPLVEAAREAGLPAAGGERVLLHQAAESFLHWVSAEAPLSEMERGLDR